jgi:glycosyltransferase involved in cell wall biosynthesis
LLSKQEYENYPFVSVVVIVLNMQKTIKKCLDSLIKLDYPPDSYEIIVVDGGSNDGTQEITASYPKIKKKVDCRMNRGLARNLGVENSIGSIIAFTDADCEAERNWLTIHVATHFAHPNVAAVCGSILHEESNEKNFIIRAVNDGEFDVSSPKRFIYYLTTSNVSFKRKNLIEAGAFDEELHIGEDTILSSKIVERGFKILFEPSAKVIHHHYANFLKSSESDYFDIVKHGRIQFDLQFVQSKLKFRLPTSSSVVLFLLPSLILLRALRFFHKTRYLYNKLRIIRNSPFVFFYSFWWMYGYFLATLHSQSMVSSGVHDAGVCK